MASHIRFRLGGVALLFAQAALAGDHADPAKDPFGEDLPKVEAATLHTQTLDEAPADVSVITRAQIRTYGYRTFGEALSSVRGFYMTRDHIYSYAGVRGFSLPGDYNTRFLVMINGHPMTDNVFSSNGFFEQDFGLDMDLVERIEIIRGPSSALYGSNGIFATINIVTVSPVDFAGAYGTVEAGHFGEKKALAAGSYYLGKGANLLLSASGVKSSGLSFYFPQFDAPPYSDGHSTGMDGEGAYHTFANLTWRGWSFTGYFNNRDKRVPLAWDASGNSFFSRGNHADDSRNFVNAAYKRTLAGGDLRLQFSYDNYHYKDRFDLITDDGLVPRSTRADGDWLSTQLTYQFHAGVLGTLTAGAAAAWDLRNLQTDVELRPQPVEVIRIDRPGRSGALFLEQEKRLSPRWKLDLGLRLDESRYYGHFLSPRLALAYQPSPKTVYKFIYGHPFRNPNAYEQFYFDNISALQAPHLQPETANTYEFSVERHFTPALTGIVNVYDYDLVHLIEDVYLTEAVAQFQNAAGTDSQGVEFELDGKPRAWLEASGSFTLQRVRQDDSPAAMSNSPGRIAKFRLATPAGRRVTLAAGILAMSSRTTWNAQSQRPVLLADFTVTLRRLLAGCDVQLGVRNALNWAYQDPVGLSLSTFPGDPRSFYVKLTRRSGR